MFDFGGAFGLYAMECEGDTDTRMGRINRAIKELRKVPNPNDAVVREAIFAQCGLEHLTNSELAYIGRSI